MKVNKEIYIELIELKNVKNTNGLLGALEEFFDIEYYSSDYYATRKKIEEEESFLKSVIEFLGGNISIEPVELYYLKHRGRYVNYNESGQTFSLRDKREFQYKSTFTQEEIESNPFLNSPDFERIPTMCKKT